MIMMPLKHSGLSKIDLKLHPFSMCQAMFLLMTSFTVHLQVLHLVLKVPAW